MLFIQLNTIYLDGVVLPLLNSFTTIAFLAPRTIHASAAVIIFMLKSDLVVGQTHAKQLRIECRRWEAEV